MKWSTPVAIPPGPVPLGYDGAVLLLGSCFAAHIGDKLRHFQINSLTNPFGVIFHPAPLLGLLRRALENRVFEPGELFERHGLWRSFEAHSSLGQPDPEAAADALNIALDRLREQLQRATHLVLTLGSAFGYRHLASGQLVANCHTVPGSEFRKELAGHDEVEACLEQILSLLHAAAPSAQAILTVSPVRHLRDGLVESQHSKAMLLTAVHRVVGKGLAAYFPAYEIVLDELRDYRFFDRDLVHPNDVAVDYIWDRFVQTWISPSAYQIMDEVDSIRKSLAHRPLHAGSQAHVSFREKLEKRIGQLQDKYPFIKFDA